MWTINELQFEILNDFLALDRHNFIVPVGTFPVPSCFCIHNSWTLKFQQKESCHEEFAYGCGGQIEKPFFKALKNLIYTVSRGTICTKSPCFRHPPLNPSERPQGKDSPTLDTFQERTVGGIHTPKNVQISILSLSWHCYRIPNH